MTNILTSLNLLHERFSSLSQLLLQIIGWNILFVVFVLTGACHPLSQEGVDVLLASDFIDGVYVFFLGVESLIDRT